MSERPQKRMKTVQHAGQVPVHNYRFNPQNVFSHIQTGTVDAEVLFNRPNTLAVLDERPVAKGHAILIVKAPAATILDALPEPAARDIVPDLQALTRAVQSATKCPGIQVLQNSGPIAGQTVPQLHFHVIPYYTPTTDADQPVTSGSGGSVPLMVLPPPSQRAALDAVEAGPLASAIRNALPPSYAPGFHHWAATSDDMEAVGHALQAHIGRAGTCVLLTGNLGAGKSTVSRGFVRSFCRDASLDVPSPTFLLCLSYKEDEAHEARPQAPEGEAGGRSVQGGALASAPGAVHHMDPYRLGQKADKMAGLINFEDAFAQDVCLIEWPDRMPSAVMKLPKRGVTVAVSGTGIQAVGRHMVITPLSEDDPSAPVLAAWRAAGALPDVSVPWRTSPAAGADQLGCAGEGQAAAGRSSSLVQQVLAKDPASWVVLGIESSCDDTAAAVIRGDGTVLAHKIASQTGLHEQYGGVKPDVARDAHAAAIGATVAGCLEEAGVAPEALSAVAVTVGPGLSLCLQVGLRHALTIAAQHQVPVVPVHHMEAHALVVRLPSLYPPPATAPPAADAPAPAAPPAFPALLLLVSGGHNMLVLCQGVGRHRILGTTLDDSAGECFDKVARLLGVNSIPGGPHLERLAAKGEPTKFKLTLPMQNGMHKASCNFSFSGLKTSVAKLVDDQRALLGLPPAQPKAAAAAAAAAAAGVDVAATIDSATEAKEAEFASVAADIAASFQRTVVLFLQQRTRRALSWLKEDCAQHGGEMPTCLVVAGGVAANTAVREGLTTVATEFGIPCNYPPIKYCTDNGLMVAWAGVERLKLGLCTMPPADVGAVEKHVDVLPRWPLGPTDPRSVVAPSCNKHRTT